MTDSPKMFCAICHRQHHAQKLPFLCPVDARNAIYESRIEHARALMENEDMAGQVDELLSLRANHKSGYSDTAAARAAQMEALKSDEAASRARTNEILARAEQLQQEVEAARREFAAKKTANERLRADVHSVSRGLEPRRARQLDETEKSIQRNKFKWNRSAETMGATRGFLCEEAARLYGLRQIRKGNVRRYEIGGIEIVELHNMHSKLICLFFFSFSLLFLPSLVLFSPSV
jgi:chromosome segregation ATPase